MVRDTYAKNFIVTVYTWHIGSRLNTSDTCVVTMDILSIVTSLHQCTYPGLEVGVKCL
jgi:hypothetical protein